MFNKRSIIAFTTLFVLLCVTQYAVCRPQSENSHPGLQYRSDRTYEPQPKDHGFYTSKHTGDSPDSRYVEISRKKAIEPSRHINDKTAHIHKSDILKTYHKRPSNYKYIESEKKYFDYFPIEDIQLKSDPNEHNIRFILLSPEDLEKKLEKASRNAQHLGEKRSKREAVERPEQGGVPVQFDVYDKATKKTKREIGVLHRRGQTYVVYFTVGGYYNPAFPQRESFSNRINTPLSPPPQIQGNYYNAFTPAANFLELPTRVNIDSRFDFPEEAPVVWSISYTPSRNVPSTTRRPPITTSTFPPLINGPEDNIDEDDDDEPVRPVPERGSNSIQQSPAPTRAPFATRPPPPARAEAPSACVWAIVNCCKRKKPDVRQSCFEQVGCQGSFWDYNPCSDFIQDKAFDHAQQFYDY